MSPPSFCPSSETWISCRQYTIYLAKSNVSDQLVAYFLLCSCLEGEPSKPTIFGANSPFWRFLFSIIVFVVLHHVHAALTTTDGFKPGRYCRPFLSMHLLLYPKFLYILQDHQLLNIMIFCEDIRLFSNRFDLNLRRTFNDNLYACALHFFFNVRVEIKSLINSHISISLNFLIK